MTIHISTLSSEQIAENTEQLIVAIKMHDFDEFERLLPVSKPTLDSYGAGGWAVKTGQMRMLEALLKVCPIAEGVESLLFNCVMEGRVDFLKHLLPYTDSSKDQQLLHSLLVRASLFRKIDCAKILIPLVDPNADDGSALVRAVVNKDTTMFDLLFPYYHHHPNNSRAFVAAAGNGCIDFVRQLIAVCDPAFNHSEALRIAVMRGYHELVKLLMPVSDVAACGSEALALALMQNDTETAEMLYPHSDLNAALHTLQTIDPTQVWEDLEKRIAQQQQQTLLQEISHNPTTVKIRKI